MNASGSDTTKGWVLALTSAAAAMVNLDQNAILGVVAAHEVGKASGTFNTFRFLGGVFGIAILAAAFAQAGGFGSAQAFGNGFARATGVSGVLSFVAAIAGLWLPGHRTMQLAPASAKTVPARERQLDHEEQREAA